MWKRFRQKRELTCGQLRTQLLAYFDGELSAARQQAVRDHLATCDTCARYAREAEALEADLFAAANRRARDPVLSRQVSARIQERVYRRMRRAVIMQRVAQFSGRVVALAILALAVGLLALWQWGALETEKTGGVQEPSLTTPIPMPTLPVEESQTGKTSRTNKMIVFAPADDSKQPVYQRLAEQFHETHPDITVNIQPTDYDASSGLAARAGQADCFVSYPALDSPGDRAALLNLEPFLNADPDLRLGDLFFVDSFRYKGLLWGLPAQGFLKVIVYNKALFDASGVDYPAPGWTLDDFFDAAVALTQGEGEPYGFVSGSLETTDLMFFLEQQGAPLIAGHDGSFDFLFDTPATRAAVQWYASLSQGYGAKPVFKTDWQARSPEAHQERQAMILGERGAMWTTYAGSGFDPPGEEIEVGIAPLPQGPGRVGDYIVDGYFISAHTAHPQECWEWIKFLSEQTELIEGVPARRSLAESRAYRQKVGEEKATVLLRALADTKKPISFRGYGLPGWTDKPFRWLAQAFDAVVEGELDVDAALAEVQQKADAYCACLAEKDGFDDATVWSDCAGERGGVAQTGSQPTPTPEPPTPVERPQPDTMITFVPFDSSQLPVYQRLAEQFYEMYPDVGVEIQRPDYSVGSGLAARTGQADCFAYYPSLESEESRAALLSLDSFKDVDPDLKLVDLDFVDDFHYKGHLWGLPVQGFPKVLAYNKSLFDTAGLDYPAPDWTLDDFANAAVALTRGEDETYGFVSGSLETTDLMFFLEQNGGYLIDENSDPVDFLFDTPATRAAMQWYADLGRVHQAKPIFKADWMARSAEAHNLRRALIGGGRAAMWISYTGSGFDPFEEEVEMGIVPLPQGPGQVGDYLVDGYFISAQTEHPQVCWDWIKFLSERIEVVQGVPARRSLAESQAYRQQVGEERATVLLSAFANTEKTISFRVYGMSGWASEPFRWLAQAFDAVVAGELSVEAALAEAQHKADTYRDCLAVKDGFGDSAAWEVCAAEVEGEAGP